jgi:hypothetical protein
MRLATTRKLIRARLHRDAVNDDRTELPGRDVFLQQIDHRRRQLVLLIDGVAFYLSIGRYVDLPRHQHARLSLLEYFAWACS